MSERRTSSSDSLRYAVLEIPAFPLHALLRLDAALRDKAAAVTEGEGRKARVAFANDAARVSNVGPGMTCVQALAECETLELRLPSLAAEKEASAALLAAAWMISPMVEETAAGVCTADLSGRNLETLHEDVARVLLQLRAQGLPARIGIADTPLTARFAAWVAEPEKWVSDGRAFLATLPVHLLGLTDSERELFHSLGLTTLGHIARMPVHAFAQRLGERGSALWRMASGEVARPLNIATPPARFEAHMDLDDAVETLEPLLFVLRRFCDRVSAELEAAGLLGESLRLALRLEDDVVYERSIRFPEATAKADVFFGALENHLASVQTEAAIVGVDLEMQPARPQHRQEGLFDAALRNPHVFFDTLARTGAVLGSARVGTPSRVKTHRPDAAVLVVPPSVVAEFRQHAAAPERGPLLRRFRPAARAMVETNASGEPLEIMSAKVHGAIAGRRGPFRVSGDWWARAWSHEEWDVELAGGGLFRLARLHDGWVIEGVYD